jgi:tetratricopeptide (TPR) repeat protein
VDSEFLPIGRMLERVRLAKDDSDAAYFFELLYLGEMVIKLLVVEVLASLQDDRERHRYALEYRLVRADGLGEWAEVLDEALTGPASQHITAAGRQSQRVLSVNVGPAEEEWQRRAVNLLNGACRCLDPGVDDMTRQRASLRQWVRQFVWLRNRTRGHGAPKSGALAMVCPALQSSIGEVIENAPAFTRAWAHLKRNLSGKYRVSSFSGDRSRFAHLTQDSGHSLPEGTYVLLDVPRMARLLFTDPDLTDFFLPNGDFRGESFEVLSYVSDERRTQDGSGYTLPVQAQPASETSAAPALDFVGDVFTNMPPRRDRYIRRAALESELAELIRDERHPVVTLQGRGGVGKTSLALEVLHSIAEENGFFAIVWFSARDIDLLPEGPRVVRADVLSTEDVARDFFGLMQPGMAASLKDAQTHLTDCLSGRAADGPFVFVLDNFETIREQSELYSYLSNAVRLPNKVLITTRTRDFKADYPIEVGGMTREEFSELVKEASGQLGVANLIDDEYEERLYEESDGHPYITKVLLGEIAHAGRKVTLKRVVATKDAMLDALFDRSFAALSPAAQRIFLTLCSWRSLVPRLGLEAVLLRPGNERLDAERAIAELEQSSLVEVLGEYDVGSDFLSVPLAAGLFGKKKLVTSPLKTAIDADLELMREFGAITTTDISHGLMPRIDRLARAAARSAEAGGDPSQELAVIQYIASEYAPAWLSLAELQQELGREPAEAIQAVNRYLESRPEDRDAWQRLVALYRRSGDSLGEMHARLQLAELAKPAFNELSSAASRLNVLLYGRELDLDADERRLMVRRLRTLMEERWTEADATDLSRLAWLCMRDHDAEAAERWAREGLRRQPENHHCQSLMRKLSSERETP